MIIQKKQEPLKFQPVTIEITLETQEEVDMLEDLCGYNISIPKAVAGIEGTSREQVKLLEYMLDSIQECL